MRSIYAEAERAIACLGPALDQNDVFINFFTAAKEEGYIDWISNQKRENPALWSTTCACLHRLLSLDYWDRLWVVQEVGVASFTNFLLGEHEIEFYDLQNFINVIADKGIEIPEHIPVFLITTTASGPGSLLDPVNSKYSPLTMLMRCSSKLCQESHDKVYAILGLFPKEVQIQILVDYNISPNKLFTVTTHTLVDTCNDLSVLAYPKFPMTNLHISSFGKAQIEIPSWAANLDFGCRGFFETWMEPWKARKKGADAAFRQDLSLKCCTFLDDGLTLLTKGFRVGRIEDVYIGPTSSSSFESIASVFDEVLEFLDYIESYCKGFNIEQKAYSPFFLLLDAITPERNYSTLEDKGFLFYYILSYHEHLDLDNGFLDKLKNDLRGSDNKAIVLRMAMEALKHRLLYSFSPIWNAESSSQLDAWKAFVKWEYLGSCALGTENMLPGDLVCVIIGCPMPIILRKQDDYYTVIGDTNIPQTMNGELAELAMKDSSVMEEFRIR